MAVFFLLEQSILLAFLTFWGISSHVCPPPLYWKVLSPHKCCCLRISSAFLVLPCMVFVSFIFVNYSLRYWVVQHPWELQVFEISYRCYLNMVILVKTFVQETLINYIHQLFLTPSHWYSIKASFSVCYMIFFRNFQIKHLIWKHWSFYVIHDHHVSYLLIYMEKMNFCGALCALLKYCHEEKKSPTFKRSHL